MVSAAVSTASDCTKVSSGITATTDALASAKATGGTGGGIDVAVILAGANDNSTTSASVRSGTSITAGSVEILADSKDRAAAQALVAGASARPHLGLHRGLVQGGNPNIPSRYHATRS